MNIRDIIIIGSGPAGYTAGIYAARASHAPIIISGPQIGGQLTITPDIENFPGFPNKIAGPELMNYMMNQAINAGVEIVDDIVMNVDFSSTTFKIFCESGKQFFSKSVIIATGALAKWLGLESEKKYRGRGVSACATCDGFFFRKKIVAVIGGGNTAVEEALYLSQLAEKVFLIHRRDTLSAEEIQINRLLSTKNIEVLWNQNVIEILGDEKKVNGLKLKDNCGSISTLDVNGVFVAIGYAPNSSIFSGELEIDQYGYIVTEPGSCKTSITGVFAAGDIQDKQYRQAITAAGQGCMAAIDADKFLKSL